MEKKVVVGESFKLTFPKVPPYKLTDDFIISKAETNKIQVAYEWDKPRHSPELHLTATRRIYERTEEALANRREFYKSERLKLDAQWRDLHTKEKHFRETFINLSSFVKTNQEKRSRAQERFKEERKILFRRCQEYDEMQEKILFMQQSKKEMDQHVREHKLYEMYLEKVVMESEDFRNVDDLINRYEALVKTKSELGRRQNKYLQDLEEARAKTMKMAEENSFRILGLNNTLANLNSRYQIAKNRAMHWESLVMAIKGNSFRRLLEMNEVKQSCWNMYLLMCHRKNESPKLKEYDFEKQLIYIKKTLQELKTVAREAMASFKKNITSTRGEVSKESC